MSSWKTLEQRWVASFRPFGFDLRVRRLVIKSKDFQCVVLYLKLVCVSHCVDVSVMASLFLSSHNWLFTECFPPFFSSRACKYKILIRNTDRSGAWSTALHPSQKKKGERKMERESEGHFHHPTPPTPPPLLDLPSPDAGLEQQVPYYCVQKGN